ncbi:MAG: CFI-box-CTERM domain-containing protein [Eubacteriales bacterium]
MEYTEIKCQFCGEKMQAPKGREEIICMFCGKKITVVQENLSGKTFDEYIFSTLLPDAFHEVEEYFKTFHKDTYEEKFKSYFRNNAEFFGMIRLAIGDGESAQESVINNMISFAESVKVNRKSKYDKESVQFSLNLYMATRIMPAIIKTDGSAGLQFCNLICQKWSKAFKGADIKAATYEEVVAGFRRKLCYVTTATCQALNLGEDCQELEVLKLYRDTYMISSSLGQDLVEKYYDIAPTIVKRINKEENPQEKYMCIWEKYLKPCLTYIEQEENEACKEKYISMVEDLYREYMEDSHE